MRRVRVRDPLRGKLWKVYDPGPDFCFVYQTMCGETVLRWATLAALGSSARLSACLLAACLSF